MTQARGDPKSTGNKSKNRQRGLIEARSRKQGEETAAEREKHC
jgi:hypothetical protein